MFGLFGPLSYKITVLYSSTTFHTTKPPGKHWTMVVDLPNWDWPGHPPHQPHPLHTSKRTVGPGCASLS